MLQEQAKKHIVTQPSPKAARHLSGNRESTCPLPSSACTASGVTQLLQSSCSSRKQMVVPTLSSQPLRDSHPSLVASHQPRPRWSTQQRGYLFSAAAASTAGKGLRFPPLGAQNELSEHYVSSGNVKYLTP